MGSKIIRIALLCLLPMIGYGQLGLRKTDTAIVATVDGQIQKWKTWDYTENALSKKQSNLGTINIKDFGAVGDGVTDDTEAIAAAIQAGNTIYFPKPDHHYKANIIITKSNLTFIIDQDVVIDGGVLHIEGVGPGIGGWNPGDPIQYVENIRVIGKLSLTERLGTYYAKNLFFDEVEIVKDSSIYVTQTADGGSRGVHFYWGTENVFANKITSRSTKPGEPQGGFFIDANPSFISQSKPRNYYINDLTVLESEFNGVWLYQVENVRLGNVVVKNSLYNGFSMDGVKDVTVSSLLVENSGENSLLYENSNDVTIQNFISRSPTLLDVNNVSGTNINIGYNQVLNFNSNPFVQPGYSKLNISSYNDLKDKPIVAGVIPGNLTIGTGVYGLLEIKGTAGALIDYYKGSTLIGEMGVEEADPNTSVYKFYTRSGGTTVNIMALLGNKVLIRLVSEYADNAAAVSAGLPIDAVYRTGDTLKIVH